jgi:hypothetical protein
MLKTAYYKKSSHKFTDISQTTLLSQPLHVLYASNYIFSAVPLDLRGKIQPFLMLPTQGKEKIQNLIQLTDKYGDK